MNERTSLFKGGRARTLLVGLFALFALLAMSACGGGSPAHIYDNAHVLDVSSVQSAASNLPYPLDIYTTSTFTGDRTAFDRTTFSKLNGDPNRIVLAIDTTHRHLYIARGRNVPLSSGEINSTVSAFASHFNSGDYTGATLAAIDTMQQSLGTGGPGGGNIFAGALPALLCIGLLLLVAVVGFGFLRRRRFGGMGGMASAPYQPPPAYPYNQGNYYGPPQGGMNPWAAGGLGAAAGGLIGYELGKEAGERDQRDFDTGGGAFGGGGDFGGGDGGNFGGGGDFGSGGGGDFGGGGGDFGGGGGGGDFGGGGGGDF